VTSPTQAANQARRLATHDKVQRIGEALQHLSREHAQVTYPAVAQRAGVSRTFLYQNADARALMTAAITTRADRTRQLQASQDAQNQATWRERALNAEAALKAARSEISAQRARIGLLLGQIRDLETSYDQDTTQRVAAENTTLKQRAGQLAQDNRTLEEKLQAARSNNRFLDKRIADLEARLLDNPASR
jgi:Family of unknown function (DUF6262)